MLKRLLFGMWLLGVVFGSGSPLKKQLYEVGA